MPWLGKVSGVVEVWYAGSSGHKALANVLTGEVNPSGKLAMTFPRSDADLPHPVIPALSPEDEGQGSGVENGPAHVQSKYTVHYDEGVKVGYKWYESEHKQPLFPFGFGLSYTSFRYSHLQVRGTSVSFDVTNTGKRAGAEVAQLYLSSPAAAHEPPKALKGYRKVVLKPGQTTHVTLTLNSRAFQHWSTATHSWQTAAGCFTVRVGGSSASLPLRGSICR
jgi:beta-glucosidase